MRSIPLQIPRKQPRPFTTARHRIAAIAVVLAATFAAAPESADAYGVFNWGYTGNGYVGVPVVTTESTILGGPKLHTNGRSIGKVPLYSSSAQYVTIDADLLRYANGYWEKAEQP